VEQNSLLIKLIEEDFGVKGNGRWWRSEEHSSLVVDAEKNLFHFNALDIHGDEFCYLTKVRGMDAADAKQYLKSHNFTGTFIHEVKNGEEVITYPKLVEIFHEALKDKDKDYFYRRTINDSSINRFQLGYFDSFYTIPFYKDGIFKQFQLRKDVPVKTIRGYYRHVGPLMFNQEVLRYTDKCVIVEGITSAIVLTQNGIPTVSYNSGADGFLKDWFYYFIQQDPIYLVYDNDSAGKSGALKTAKILGETKCKIYTFEDFEEPKYDANNYFIDKVGDGKDFMKLLEEKSKYSFELESKRRK
jgi:DNA primase